MSFLFQEVVNQGLSVQARQHQGWRLSRSHGREVAPAQIWGRFQPCLLAAVCLGQVTPVSSALCVNDKSGCLPLRGL